MSVVQGKQLADLIFICPKTLIHRCNYRTIPIIYETNLLLLTSLMTINLGLIAIK